MTDINALIAEMRAGLEGVTPGPWAYEPHGDTGQYGVGVIVPPDIDAAQLSGYQDDPENIIAEGVAVEVDGQLNAAHIARCSPANIAALLDEIERLRAEMRRRGKEMIRKRSTIANIVYGMEDEGDRVFFGSTNDADQLRALSECLDDFALRQEEVNAIDWPKLATERYAEVERLRADNARLRKDLLEATALVARYRKETPLGNQPHMIAHVADDFIARSSKAMEASNGNQ